MKASKITKRVFGTKLNTRRRSKKGHIGSVQPKIRGLLGMDVIKLK